MVKPVLITLHLRDWPFSEEVQNWKETVTIYKKDLTIPKFIQTAKRDRRVPLNENLSNIPRFKTFVQKAQRDILWKASWTSAEECSAVKVREISCFNNTSDSWRNNNTFPSVSVEHSLPLLVEISGLLAPGLTLSSETSTALQSTFHTARVLLESR